MLTNLFFLNDFSKIGITSRSIIAWLIANLSKESLSISSIDLTTPIIIPSLILSLHLSLQNSETTLVIDFLLNSSFFSKTFCAILSQTCV